MNLSSSLNFIASEGIKAATARVGVATAASLSVVWLSRKVENLTGQSIGKALDKIVPARLQEYSFYTMQYIQKPIRWLSGYVHDRAPRELLSTTLAPVVEEVVYRFGVQQGIDFILESAGVNSTLAKTTAIGITAFLFGMAHNNDLRDDRFVSTMLPGVVYGIVQSYSGLTEAIAVHSLDNLVAEIKKKLKNHP